MSRLSIIKIFSISCYFIIALGSIKAQNTEIMIDIAIKSYENGDYHNANQLFESALAVDSNKLNLQFHHGLNLIKLHQFKKATFYIKKVVNKDPSGKIFPQASFYLGEMLKHQGKYKEAILEFKKAKAHYIHNKNNFYFLKSSREINSTIYAMRHSDLINEDVKVSKITGSVNGYNADFAGFEDNGNFYFSSVKDSLHAQIYIQNKNKKIKKLSPEIDDNNFHNANGIFYKNHQYFLFTRCDSVAHCQIMISKNKDGNWMTPELLSDELNLNSHNVTQPFLAKVNGNNILFFSSDKKGGLGKLDIWYAEILDDLSIGNIKNAGPNINSPENDITPFYHEPSNRLYFSSSWHNGFGGYDVFYSHWNDSIFETPVNADQPINSSWNDLYFWINNFGKHGYITSNRNGSLYNSSPNCCPDIWEFKTDHSIANKEEILSDLDNDEIFKHKTGISLPLALYFHNDEPMPKSLATKVNETYPETYVKYLALKPLYVKSFSNGNSIAERKSETEQINYFFDQYVMKEFKKLEKFKNQLIPLLNEHESIEITIKGFASPLAKSDYNTNLSKRRISSLINYFNEVDSGALAPFIINKKLILKSAPFGENKTGINTSDDVNNTKKSIYSPKAAMERRIEIQEVIFKN